MRHTLSEFGCRPATRLIGALRAAAVCGLMAHAGCSSSTAPRGEGEVAILFSPSVQGQQMTLAQTISFSVAAPDAKSISVNWRRGGVIVSNASEYTYVPSALGVDTLRVQAKADESARNYFWVINVESTGSTLPPAVNGVLAGPGPAPGDVEVKWNKVGTSTYPLAAYAVRVSFDGPITPQNWDQAREVRRVIHNVAQVAYQVNLTAGADGMIPGAEVWVSVRVIDELGQMSPINQIGYAVVTTAWWLNGVVSDDRGLTHAGIIVAAMQPVLSTNTDLAGRFRLGPFRNIDLVSVRTNSSNAPISGWYDFQSAPLDSVSGRDLELVLITRHPLDGACGLYGGQFLNYLRYMAKTEFVSGAPAASVQWKWSSYPLRAWVPELVSPAGVDFGAAARFAMAFYDSVMGEPYFEPAADSASANVVFRFASDRPQVFGELSLLAPRQPDLGLGDVIPEQVQVYVLSNLLQTRFVKEVTLHELGHALGLLSHTNCAESGYLMVVSAGGNLDNASPVHPDEQNAIRTIRRLPQGVSMDRYSVGQ